MPTNEPDTPSRPRAIDVREMVLAALLAALLAVSALVVVPIGPVPGTLQILVVVLVSLLTRPRVAALALGAYIAAGAAGLPVFAGARGGLGVLIGPTGGYLWGFLAGGIAGAWVRERMSSGPGADATAAGTVVLAAYLLGWWQLSLVTGTGAVAALLTGVAPFIVPDVVKASVAVAAAIALRRALPVPEEA